MAKDISKANEPIDYVAQMRNMNEASRRNEIARIKWHNDYQWLIDEYKNVEEEMRGLCREKNVSNDNAELISDERSVRPVPITTNGLYGWLAKDVKFNLEKYGSYIVKYHDPLKDIDLLSGDVPNLATGKPFV